MNSSTTSDGIRGSFPDAPGSQCPDHHVAACPVCLAPAEVHDAIYAVQTTQDFESPDAPYQHDVLVFAEHARVLAATLRGFYAALSGEGATATEIDPSLIAENAIGLFLENRDMHGQSEDVARANALIEIGEATR